MSGSSFLAFCASAPALSFRPRVWRAKTLLLYAGAALTVLFSPGVCLALTGPEAESLLTGWIAANEPGYQGVSCLNITPGVYQNGGYAIKVDASGCPDPAAATGRWRIDAQTAEVFKENDKGKFVLPPSVQDKGGLANVAFLAGRASLLPDNAKVIEYAPLGAAAPDRAYVLWMIAPKRVEHEKGEIYTCPEFSRGSYWSGPARLSLFDTKTGALRNTISLIDPLEETDSFDLPYRIPSTSEFAYFVPEGAGKGKQGRPNLLRLRDLTGNGSPFEFYLASAGNCMLMLYGLFGYDQAKDEAVQYPVLVTTSGGGKPGQFTTNWLNFWPVKKGGKGGRYAWEVDLRGRAGCLEKFDIGYDKAAGRFAGKLSLSECEPQ